MPEFDISFEVTLDRPHVDVAAMMSLGERVMSGENLAPGMSLSVLVTDDDEVRAMNRQFLGLDEPTDVLAFPEEGDDFVTAGEEERLLGDIAISLPTAARQAAELGHSLEQELSHLLVHGILHLIGYDHVTGPEDEARMRAREEHYLGSLGQAHRH